jgi:uncharacterized protein (TIGR02270 family)
MTSPVIPAVLERHAEEAAFLWLLRDRAVARPHYTLDTLTELDQRVEAHLDGLRVAGEIGARLAHDQFLEFPEPGEVFVAAVLAFETASTAAIPQLLDAVEVAPALGRAVVSAVGWLSDEAAAVALPLLHSWGTSAARYVGLAGAAIRREPIPSNVLDTGFRDPKCLARAIEAVGELADSGRLSAVRDRMADSDLDVRFAAAWTVARLTGDPRAVAELQTIALTEYRHRQRSATLVVRRLDPAAARRWVEMLWQIPGCERVAIQASGALGDPALVPRLLEQITIAPLARLVGEALGHIAGARLAEDKLDGPSPVEFEAGPTDDPDDALIDLDPDDGLDWPNPKTVLEWWTTNRRRFPSGTRHICGRPINDEHLRAVLRDGYQRQRAGAALELALRHNRAPLFEVRSPGWRQQIV